MKLPNREAWTWLSVAGKDVLFPAIYQARGFSDFKSKHSIGIRFAGLRLHSMNPVALALAAEFAYDYKAEGEIVTATSNYPPEVECGTAEAVDHLVRELQHLDARNVGRDRVFTEAAFVSIAVSPYYWQYGGHGSLGGVKRGYSLNLHRVVVALHAHVSDIKDGAM